MLTFTFLPISNRYYTIAHQKKFTMYRHFGTPNSISPLYSCGTAVALVFARNYSWCIGNAVYKGMGGVRGSGPPANFFNRYLIFNQISKPKINKITIYMFWSTPHEKISGYGLDTFKFSHFHQELNKALTNKIRCNDTFVTCTFRLINNHRY